MMGSPLGRKLRDFWETQVWLAERRQVAMRPWEQDFLHWSRQPDGWVLHGHLTPPPGRRLGVTSDGWCACASAPAQSVAPVRPNHTRPNTGSTSGT